MIIQTRIYVCDICGKIVSEVDKDGNYDEDTAYYPKGWIDVYDTDGNNSKAHCSRCAKEHADEYTKDKDWDGWGHYKKKVIL